MTPELEKYYEDYFDLFITDGWKQFIKDLEESTGNFNIRYVKTPDELYYAQGQLQVVDMILNWETTVRNGYDSVQEETEE